MALNGFSASSAARDHRVIDCVFNRNQLNYYPSGNHVVDLKVPSGASWIQKAKCFLLRIYRLRQIKKKFGIELTISHLEGADYINVLSRIHDKVLLCVHGTKLHDKSISGPLGWVRRKLLIPVLYRRASHIVCVSEAIKRELITQFNLPYRDVTVINNFFDVDVIKKMADEDLPADYRRLALDYDVIINTGRLAFEKNQQLLIKLMPYLLEKKPRLKLVILGDGDQQMNLVLQAQDIGLTVQLPEQPFSVQNQVFFPGFKKNPFPFLRNAKVFVLPSLWEGFPLVVCKAMICRVPVVAHDCPTGPREIICPECSISEPLGSICYCGSGVLIPFSERSDVEVLNRWRSAILALLNKEALRLRLVESGEGRAYAFGKETVYKAWVDLINRHQISS